MTMMIVSSQSSLSRCFWSVLLLCLSLILVVQARPVVRNIQSSHEFERLLHKHAHETGLPVIVDFYSDSCGPCRMMAPIFKKMGTVYSDKAVFVKVDTNSQYQLSSKYQVRSLPTFMTFVGGRQVQQQVGGIGEGGLKAMVDAAVRQAQTDNIQLTLTELTAFYQKVDASKTESEIQQIFQKCVDMNKNSKHGASKQQPHCVGAAVNQLVRRLRQKYKSVPKTTVRFTEEDQKAKTSTAGGSSSSSSSRGGSSSSRSSSGGGATGSPDNQPNLHLATLEQLQEELQRRQDEERERQVENESEEEDEPDPDYHKWTKGDFPEKLVIIGGGPAGMAAALYGARAGLKPLIIAPSMGGQLLAKGVDVENYPGVYNSTGPGLIASMRKQAAHFGACFEDDVVIKIDASQRPLSITTNATGVIKTHSIVIATGAEANWLGVQGEYELRGGGVSSCATCDGFLFANQDVLVVGGGDAAMEDALVLARTSRKVTVIHRRDAFRASKVLADRVLQHPTITVIWNTKVKEIVGKELPREEDETEDLDIPNQKVVTGVVLENVGTGETSRLECNAVFVAIGHTPSTSFLEGVVEFDANHPGYLWTNRQATNFQTQTSVKGIFAAGDVADAVYRQAVTSAGSGAAAALDAERYLSEEGLGNEEAELEAELLAELMADSAARSAQTEGAYNAYAEAGGRIHGMKESVASEL